MHRCLYFFLSFNNIKVLFFQKKAKTHKDKEIKLEYDSSRKEYSGTKSLKIWYKQVNKMMKNKEIPQKVQQ